MSEPESRLLTVEDLLAMPVDEACQVELIDGVVYVSPRPRARHNRVQTAISHRVGGPYDVGDGGPGGWWILVEPLVRFGPRTALGPDLAGWRRERVPVFPDVLPVPIVPDWVCEVLSPSTALRDRTRKMEIYAGAGVGHLWVIDPLLRTLEAFGNEGGRWLRLGAWTDGETPAVAPFEAVALDVGALFFPRAEPDLLADSAAAP